MLPFSIPPPFLSRSPNVNPQALTQEESLLRGLPPAPNPQRFVQLDALHTLYMRQFRSGGMEGVQWVRQSRDALIRHILDERLFSDFLDPQAKAGMTLTLPVDFPKPPSLRLDQQSMPPIVHLPFQNIPETSALGYFQIDSLILGQEILSDRKIDFFDGLLAGAGFSPIAIARDLHGNGYHLHNGYHRTYACRRRGDTHVLGRMDREASLRRVNATFDTMEILPHDVFLERIRKMNAGAFKDLPPYLLSGDDED